MITFRDFMESSLYDPEGGYYPNRTVKEDFYTAPELHPVFGEILAADFASRLDTIAKIRPQAPLFIVEMGAGNGTLARQILTALKKNHRACFDKTRYILVERCESVLLDAITSLQDLGGRILGYSRLEDLQPVCGLFFSNELVDAFPVHVLEKQEGRMRELYVERTRKHGGSARTRLGLLSSRTLVHEGRRVAKHLPEGQRHAVNLEARAWMRQVSQRLRIGSVVTVDYGKRFTAGVPNPPRAFHRHQVGEAITARPGRQDLTASVDFADLENVGLNCGLNPALYTTLGRFMIDRGILELLPRGNDAAAFKERAQMKTIFHPDGMGERFKVLVQEKGL